jgi:carbon storage regulator CsrA
MLVLSRKENEKVLFPNLGIAFEILRVGGGKVRLGIQAPGDVSVVRDEIASEQQLAEFAHRLQERTRHVNHELRNRLHSAVLGLAVVQQQLAADHAEDAEQTVVRLLDAVQGIDQELGAGQQAAAAVAAARRRALVVEDNHNERRLLASYLALSGFEVESVDDGVQALDYLASHEPPDAVVLDMHLPRLGGEQAVNVLRSDPRFRGLRVYAVSGMSRHDVRIPVGPNGVNQWFTKPLDPRQLVDCINAEISGKVA